MSGSAVAGLLSQDQPSQRKGSLPFLPLVKLGAGTLASQQLAAPIAPYAREYRCNNLMLYISQVEKTTSPAMCKK